jgi:transcriptional regulator with XRE-family HTH domain
MTADDLVPLEQTLADLLAGLRNQAGLTQRALANRIGYRRATVGTAERRQRVPAEDFWVRADEVLQADGRLLRAYAQLAHARQQRKQAALVQTRAARAARVAAWQAEQDQPPAADVESRGEQPLAADDTTPTGAPPAIGSPWPTLRLVEEDVDPLTRRYRSLYHQVPSAVLLPAVLGHLQLVDGLLARAGDHTRRRLGSAVLETAGFAAWLCGDMGDGVRMLRLYRTAEAAAEVSGERALAERGEHLRAADEADAAEQQVGRSAEPVVVAWLAALQARVLAGGGRGPDALAALNRAGQALDRAGAGEAPEWMFEFDHGRLAAYTGACLLRLGRPVEAAAALADALAALPQTCMRRRAEARLDLAHARLQAGEADEAARLAGTAVETFAGWNSVAGLRRVVTFADSLAAAGHPAAAGSLREQALAHAG